MAPKTFPKFNTLEMFNDGAVLSEEQGKGFGTMMLQALIDEYVTGQKQNLGLLVREENPEAKKLYLRRGFLPVDIRMLAGKRMEHMQIRTQ